MHSLASTKMETGELFLIVAHNAQYLNAQCSLIVAHSPRRVQCTPCSYLASACRSSGRRARITACPAQGLGVQVRVLHGLILDTGAMVMRLFFCVCGDVLLLVVLL